MSDSFRLVIEHGEYKDAFSFTATFIAFVTKMGGKEAWTDHNV